MNVADAAHALALLASHEERPFTLAATKARAQFFPLLEAVVNDPTQVIFVEHKDLPGRGMLVGEGYQQYVRQLEAVVRGLLGPAHGSRYSLAGSLRIASDDDDAVERDLGELRAEQARAAAAKFDDR